MASALFHPDFKASPYWCEAWRPNADGSADLPARADVVIVGAGYGGLATALELRRGGAEAVVIEANEFGSGASSRNGDAVSETKPPSHYRFSRHPATPILTLVARFPCALLRIP